MSWQAIAEKEYRDAIRSRWLLALSVFFVLLVSAMAYVIRPPAGETASANQLLSIATGILVTTLVPLIAVVVGYNAVVGERESGSLKLLLSLPHSRSDVVFGKVLGRSVALATPIVVGFVLPALVLAVGPFTFEPASYVGYTLLTAFLGAVFVSIAVGWSAAAPSHRLAMAGAVGIYFLFVPLWGAVQMPLSFYLAFNGIPGWLPFTGNELMQFLRLLNPNGSFKVLSGAILGGGSGSSTRMQVAAGSMLLSWLLVPPLLGYWRFEAADL